MRERPYNTIFISYRRGDTAGYARLIKDKLDKEFQVFLDVENIDAGENFSKKLQEEIKKSDIMLAVIGKHSCEEFKKREASVDYVVEEIQYAKSLGYIDIIPVLIDDASMPKQGCLPKEISFFSTLNAIVLRHDTFHDTLKKLTRSIKKSIYKKHVAQQKDLIKHEFNTAENLLNILYPWKQLIDEEAGNIKYQYWTCGKEADPHYYFVLFPSTTAPLKAIEYFTNKIKKQQIPRPHRLLTVLKNSPISRSAKLLLQQQDVHHIFYTYQNYYWKECIPNIKDYTYNIEVDEYYVDQHLYAYEDTQTEQAIGIGSEIVMEYIKNDNSNPILAIIAAAGIGKTTFIEYIIKKIDSNRKLQCIYISSDEIKEKFMDVKSLPEINSIYDLYQYCDDIRKFDAQTLFMGITSGSITIIIDGLEEIMALFNKQDKFNSDAFFDTLIEMNNQLSKCKIIVASRELTEDNRDILDREKILLYRLQGFDDTLVQDYLYQKRFPSKRFEDDAVSEKHIKKVEKYLAEVHAKMENKNVIPYILDLICESVEEEFEEENEDLSFVLHHEYLSNNDPIDTIVYAYFFSRELTRQSQSYPEAFTPRDLAYICIDIVMDIGWIFSEDKMMEVVSNTYPTYYKQIVKSLKRAPFLIRAESNAYKFKYDFLYHYFIGLYLIQVFGGEETRHYPYKVLSKMPSEVIADVLKYFSHNKIDIFKQNMKELYRELLDKIKQNPENVSYQEAASQLITLLIKVHSDTLSAEQNMALIKTLYGDTNKIEHLYLLGPMYPLDFRDTEIWHARFSNYSNFFKSKFHNTVFYYTTFTSLDIHYKNEDIWNKIRFDTCELGSLKALISKQNVQYDIKKRMKKILDNIANHKYSLVPKDVCIIECLVKAHFIKQENDTFILMRSGRQFRNNGTPTKRTQNLVDCMTLCKDYIHKNEIDSIK